MNKLNFKILSEANFDLIFQFQETELKSFFSVFYFIINLGSLLSMLLTPVLRCKFYFIVNLGSLLSLLLTPVLRCKFYFITSALTLSEGLVSGVATLPVSRVL